jgi:peroxiredoxin
VKPLAPICLVILLVFPQLAPADPKAADPFKALELIRPSRAQAAKEFTVPTPDGKSLKLADYKGKVVFLNFWATWCPPCREEMPAMERLYRRYKEKGLVVVALSVDAEGAPVVIPFVKEHHFSFPLGLDPKMAVAEKYGVRALPSSFLIDRKGQLAALALGPRQWDEKPAHALIELLLK